MPGEPFEVPEDANPLVKNLARTPTALTGRARSATAARRLGDHAAAAHRHLRVDSKQILLEFGEGDTDNAMAPSAHSSGDGARSGGRRRGARTEGARLDVGQRVVLNPWLSCGPRGIEPPCPACENGDYSLCWSFTDGDIKAGIHTGVSADVTGGYAELMPAHDSMLHPVPEGVPDEMAVFADPFSVSLHAITASTTAVGPGAGVRSRLAGSCAVAILTALYPDVEVAVVARFERRLSWPIDSAPRRCWRPNRAWR